VSKRKETLTIRLPYLPARELSPNWRSFMPGAMFAVKRERDQLQQDVAILAKAELSRVGIDQRPAFRRISIKYTFLVPTQRHRDADNYIARMKPAQDALVKIGVVQDDTHALVMTEHPCFKKVVGDIGTIIEIKGAE
jgi:Holliday junction resolvase RusA-like endonuclease